MSQLYLNIRLNMKCMNLLWINKNPERFWFISAPVDVRIDVNAVLFVLRLS